MYLNSLSYRNIEEMMLERGTKVDHATLNRWVIEYSPLLENELRKNHKKKIGSSWRMDETYIKIKGEWNYLYRAKAGIKAINLQMIIFSLLGCALMQIDIRQIKYLNNIVEQDHRGIKRITKPMMGFKAFHSTEAALVGIELYRMLKKGQHVNAKNSTAFEQFYALAA